MFLLRDIFPFISRGKRLKTADHISGSTPYVSSSAINNGVDDFIGNTEHIRTFSDCLTIANSGSVGTPFYHNYLFIASDHVTALKNPKINIYSYLFVASVLRKFQKKYNFNREINDVRIKKESIPLPTDKNGNPDWNYMEQYTKRILLSMKEQYLKKKME